MSYDENHTLDDCDSCLKRVGIQNLKALPFWYMDKNDKVHPDMSGVSTRTHRMEPGYRQYFCCDECYAVQERIGIARSRRRGDDDD